jgi:hypothetical protein
MQDEDDGPRTEEEAAPQEPMTEEAAPQEARRQDISATLSELDAKKATEQAEFWMSCVCTPSKEIEEIGGLAPDEVVNDILSRYFDSSVQGLYRVFSLCLRDQDDEDLRKQGLLSQQGLRDALHEHYQYYHSATEKGPLLPDAQKCFDILCEKVVLPINEISFGYAVRRIRLALLLKLNEKQMCEHNVYHMDYDEKRIYTPFNGFKPNQFKERYHTGRKYTIPVMEKQTPVSNMAEYLFTSKMKKKGKNHWVHLQNPKIHIVLAIGQVYRMPGTIQATMRNLKQAQPQIRLSRGLESKRNHSEDAKSSHDHPIASTEPAYEWSALIYPGISLDYASRKSLEQFQSWFRGRQHFKQSVSEEPPSLLVSCIEFSVGIIWSDVGTNSIVTMCGPAHYIGRWITDIKGKHEKSPGRKFLDWLTCASCCRRSNRRDGHDRVPQIEAGKDPEKPTPRIQRHVTEMINIEEDLEGALQAESTDHAGMKATDGATSPVTFDGIFEKTLQALETNNSLLRMGTNEQLLTRIILNSTQEYLDIADIYDAAIHRLSYLLDEPDYPEKDRLMQKISDAKLEIAKVMMLVHPFAERVLHHLHHLSTSSRVLVFQVRLIDNNVTTFLSRCKSLMEQCESLADSYERQANNKMNNILNVLTFITFVITPMQIMTGLYGMNFKIIPELHWHHGYVYFWVLSISLRMLFACVLYSCTQEAVK